MFCQGFPLQLVNLNNINKTHVTGKELKELRTAHGLTQKDIANLLHKTPGFISILENGRYEITDETEEKLRAVLDNSGRDDDVSKRIIAARGDLSQREFAKKVGCSNTQISLVERGISRPSNDLLMKIAAATSVSVKWLMCGVDGEDVESELKEIEVWYRSHPEERKEFIMKIRGQ